MTTLKFKGHIHAPCPLIAVWHSEVSFSFNDYARIFCEKYEIKGLLRTCLANFVVGRFVRFLHDLYTNAAFTYLVWRVDKMVLLSPSYIKRFFPAKLFRNKITSIPNMNTYEVCEDIVTENRNGVVFMGRLCNSVKRIDLLLRIWSEVEKYSNDAFLEICGTGPDELMLRNLVTSFSLQRVRFCGHVNPKEAYERNGIVVLTSRYEGFPMVILEAMSFGCVPVVFDTFSAAPDMIADNVNGRIIPEGDITGYAEALIELITCEDKRKHLAFAALKNAKCFATDKITHEWLTLMDEVIEKKKK